jgi:hypothetical protein
MFRPRSAARFWLTLASLAFIPSVAAAQSFVALQLTFDGHLYDGYNSHAIYVSLLVKPSIDGDPWLERGPYVVNWARGADHGIFEVNGDGDFKIDKVGTYDGASSCALQGGPGGIGTLVNGDTITTSITLDWDYCPVGVDANVAGGASGQVEVTGPNSDVSFIEAIDSAENTHYVQLGAHAGAIPHGSPVTITAIPTAGFAVEMFGRRSAVSQPIHVDTVANTAIVAHVSFFVPPSFTISLGGNSPTGVDTVAKGTTKVPMLEFSLDPSSPQTINSVTVQGRGTGDESVDVVDVALYDDLNGNGHADSGEPLLAQSTFPSNDGTVTLDVQPPFAVSGPTNLLVTYDFGLHIAGRLAGTVALALLPLLFFPGVRRKNRMAVVCMALISAVAVASCGGGSDSSTGPPPPAESSTYQATLTAVDVSGSTQSGLSLSGAKVTVLK